VLDAIRHAIVESLRQASLMVNYALARAMGPGAFRAV